MAVALSALYIGALFYLLFLLPRRLDPSAWHSYETIRLVPFTEKWRQLLEISGWRLKEYNLFLQDTIGNVMLFFPLPLVLRSLTGREMSMLSTALTALLLSTGIELAQHVFRLGVADVDDILFNTAGALAGVAALRLFQSYRSH